jgi:AcrR family transcriptional regulator
VPTLGNGTRRGRPRHDAVELLRASAFELFALHGYDNVTTDDIAEHAGISRRTLYRRFGNKEAIVLWDLEHRVPELLDALDRQPIDATPSELVVGTMSAFVAARGPVDTTGIKSLMAQGVPAVRRQYEAIITGIESGIAVRLAIRYRRNETDPAVRTCAAWFSSTVRVAVDEWVATGGDDTFIERIAPSFVNLGAALDMVLAPA